jgi:FeS assembly protein IscX
MPKKLTWDDAEDIGIALSDAHPEVDPLALRFTDLHRYVTELPDFGDDPKSSNEGKLEAIQMAWHEEFQDRTQA